MKIIYSSYDPPFAPVWEEHPVGYCECGTHNRVMIIKISENVVVKRRAVTSWFNDHDSIRLSTDEEIKQFQLYLKMNAI